MDLSDALENIKTLNKKYKSNPIKLELLSSSIIDMFTRNQIKNDCDTVTIGKNVIITNENGKLHYNKTVLDGKFKIMNIIIDNLNNIDLLTYTMKG